jgi:hypothetical protein
MNRSFHLGMSLLTLRPGQVGGAETYVRSLLSGLATAPEVASVQVLANESVGRKYKDLYGPTVSLLQRSRLDRLGPRTHRALHLASSLIWPNHMLGNPSYELLHFPIAVECQSHRFPG